MLVRTRQNRAALAPHVVTVVFNASSYYKSRFNTTLQFEDSVRWISITPFTARTNRYGTPIFKDLILSLERRVNASFYGYCNGDLLFDGSMVPLLIYLRQLISRGVLHPRVLIRYPSDVDPRGGPSH